MEQRVVDPLSSGALANLAPGVWLAAALKLGLHAASSARGYGWFGDELYYLACARHLAWGYVDHPPLSIGVLAGWTALFGDSLAAVRAPAILAGVACVVLAGALARALGGGRRAQTVAAVATAVAPVNLVVHGYYSMNAIDTLVWSAAFLLALGVMARPSPPRWLALGALLGLGLLNKISVLWLGAGLLVGWLATRWRHLLATPWPWLAGALAAALFGPHLWWQVAHGWPTVEFVHVATHQKMLPVGPAELFAQQVLVMHPLTLPLWAGGLAWLMFAREGRPFRPLGIVFLVVAAILIAEGTSRPNYLTLAQPPLLAAGSVALERLAQRRPRWRVVPAVATGLLVVTGLLGAPLALPLLPPSQLVSWQRILGLAAPVVEKGAASPLDPHFADMFGWNQLADEVARVWSALPPERRSAAAVFTVDYASAGALDLLGPVRGVPGALSGHNSYWLWGPDGASGTVLLVVGFADYGEVLSQWYADVRKVGKVECRWCRANRPRTLWLAQGLRKPFDDVWRDLRHYD